MNLIFDTHAHYDDKAFEQDRDSIIQYIFNNGVCRAVNQGTDIKTSEMSIKLSQKYDGFYAAVGLHPECLDNNSLNDIEKIKSFAVNNKKVVAIGEIGLDYFYEIPKDLQKEVFEKQLQLANELNMPVNIHDREAHCDTFELLKKYKPKGIVHCFSGSAEMAAEIIKLGMYIGMGGVVTFKNAKKAVSVIKTIPLERLVLETDCPYLSPVPFRGKRCDSSMIKYTAQCIAEIKDLSVEEILTATRKNAFDVYNINMEGD